MDFSFPKIGEKLGDARIDFLKVFEKNCRRTILQMLKKSQSGHPGGSLSCLDFLATLYAFQISKTYEKVVISNGHISPGIYSVLAEMGAVSREDLVENFRAFGSKFEGHASRHVCGIDFGTGPLGAGVSAAAGFAVAEKKSSQKMVFATLGDGEMQEGQVHEMALFAAAKKLGNLCVFVDYNRVQLTDSLDEILPIEPAAFFRSKNWEVIEIDGHDPEQIWAAISAATKNPNIPTAIIGKTIMGNGIEIFQKDGESLSAAWHGKAPTPQQVDAELAKPYLQVSADEEKMMQSFRDDRKFNPNPAEFFPFLEKNPEINIGTPAVFPPEKLTDCRSAFGLALADLAEKNPQVFAATADLRGSVMTKFVAEKNPNQHLEFGICEQNMVSAAGAISLSKVNGKNAVPFVSTFGAFMSSRAKDQARLNDINHTNVKMVSTHCGLSVGEDGPTHQSIDDGGSFLGFFATAVCEPADPNHCDRIVRFAASVFGNFYIRMGRAKLPVLTREDGSVFFDENYNYVYGRTDLLRKGEKITIVASGAAVHEALAAHKVFKKFNPEIIIASSIKKFDQTLADSLSKTKNVLTVEDHNCLSGLGAAVSYFCAKNQISLQKFQSLGVENYQLSGKPAELYNSAGIDSNAILRALENF